MERPQLEGCSGTVTVRGAAVKEGPVDLYKLKPKLENKILKSGTYQYYQQQLRRNVWQDGIGCNKPSFFANHHVQSQQFTAPAPHFSWPRAKLLPKIFQTDET